MIRRVFSVMLCLCMIFSLLNVSAFTINYDGKSEEYTGRTVSLFVNGEKIESDMPAIIMNSRTLVPARAVFEKLGAEVLWNEAERRVSVITAKSDVKLIVDSSSAFVNGVETALDCPARIINDRLMIPVRFPAEAIGCSVLWNDAECSVRINMEHGYVNVTSIESVYENGYVTTTVLFDGEASEVQHFVLDNNRIVADITGAKLTAVYPNRNFDNLSVKTVRFGQFSLNPYVLRLVADVDAACEYSVEKTANSVVFRVKATERQAEVQPPASLVPELGIELSEGAKNKLVLIDPGHGGTDVGAVGRDGDTAVLYEKDVNLAVSLYLNRYLTAAGVKTYMMRDDDSTVSLYDRPEIANNLGADLYVSVHSNSFGTDKPHGTTVLYYANGATDSSQGRILAKNIQKELVSALGTYDRGLTNGSEMYVIRKTVMPSVIVEMAFISNPDDRRILADDNCRKLAASAIARGIIKTLNATA